MSKPLKRSVGGKTISRAYSSPNSPIVQWVKKTGKNGMIVWDGLVPGHEYRLALWSRGVPVASIYPSIEGPSSDALKTEMSGGMFLRPGDSREFRAVCYMDTAIVGQIGMPTGASVAAVDIKLFSVIARNAKRLEKKIVGMGVREGERFSLNNIAPGAKWLRCVWQTRRNGIAEMCFATREVSVDPDTEQDIGVIVPRTGPTLSHELLVKLHPPAEAPAADKPVCARLYTRSTDSIRKYDLSKNVAGDVEIPIGRVCRFIGLPKGKVTLVAEFEESGLKQSDGWPTRRRWELTVPRDQVAHLYASEVVYSMSFDMARVPVEKGMLWAAFLHNRRTGNAWAKILDTQRPPSLCLKVPRGHYDIILLPSAKWSQSWKPEKRGWYWEARDLFVQSDMKVAVSPLKRAYQVTGVVTEPKDKYVVFGLQDWPAGFAFYRAPLGDDGSFLLRCVPGNRVVKEVLSGSGVQVLNQDISGVRIRL